MSETRDIAWLSIVDGGTSLEHFAGAITAAERLGHRVEVRVIRSPSDGVHSLVAEASPRTPPDTTTGA